MSNIDYNVYITLDELPRQRLSDFPNFRLAYTHDAGWALWRKNQRGPDVQIAGQFNHAGMRVDVGGNIIVDSLTEQESGSVAEQLTAARGLALYLFHEKKDRGGAAYINHVMRVAQRMPDPVDSTIGWLHDVVEDTSTTLDDLRETFSAEVVDAVDALTRREGEDYLGVYIPRLVQNERACRVKQSDLMDNMDLHRLPQVQRADVARWLRYDTAMGMVVQALVSHATKRIVARTAQGD